MRFYNTGKYEHVTGGLNGIEVTRHLVDNNVVGHPLGTAIVNLPGSGIYRALPVGEWIEVDERLFDSIGRNMSNEQRWSEAATACRTAVQNACPSLLTEEQHAAFNVGVSSKPKE